MNNIITNKNKLVQSGNQRIVLFQLIILLLLLMNTMVSCGNSGKIGRINRQQIIGVQLADGEMVTAKTANRVDERRDEVIQSFLQKWLYLSFNWKTSDVAVEIEELNVKVPGNTYAATFSITTRNNFRDQYTKELASLISQATGGRNIQSAISIEHLSQPKQIRQGVWEAKVISTWTGMDAGEGKEVFSVPFNKKVRLKAIPVATKQTFQTPEQVTDLQRIVDGVNQYGLQIIAIENYDL